MLHGGSQEGGLRAGTENLPGILGLGEAIRLCNEKKSGEAARLAGLRQKLVDGLCERIPGLLVNGPHVTVAAHVISVSFPEADAEVMLLRLSQLGVAVSMGSACTSHSIEPSHVLTAMGLPRAQIDATLRISLGYPTTEDEIGRFVDLVADVYGLAAKNA
jgi:cysteine desulfurase